MCPFFFILGSGLSSRHRIHNGPVDGGQAKIEASPTGGDGKIYFQDHNGEVFVVAADPGKFNLLHRVQFGDQSMRSHRSSLALANNRVFLRSKNTLYCLGK